MSESLDEIKKYFDEKFSEFKDEISRPVAAATVVKPPSVKSKGYQMQVDFNCELLTLIQKLQVVTAPLENCDIDDICTELNKKLNHRNKLIRLADKSPGGWITVSQYEQDDLASDEEDSKRIKQAEKSALSILKGRDDKKKADKKQFSPGRYSPYAPAPIPSGSVYGSPQSTFRPYSAYSHNFVLRPRFFPGPRPSDQCFACGKFGHYRSNCPHDVLNRRLQIDGKSPTSDAVMSRKQ